MDVDVVSVSVDSYYVHKMWNDNELGQMVEGGIPYQMGADQNGQMGREYGVYNETAGVEQRGRFLIDPDGIIQSVEIIGNPVGQNVNENIRQIKAFQFIRENNGKVACPASWEPGQQTLTPRPGLVGNVWKQWKPTLD